MDFRRALTSGCALALCATVVGGFTSSVPAQQPEPKSQLASVIQDSIRLLERKQYVDFIKTYMRPAELDELVAKYGAVEKVADEFGKSDRPATMLKALQAASKLEPTFSREGTIATYRFETPIGRDRSLSLQRIGDRWFLRD